MFDVLKDMTGLRFGRWTVIERAEYRSGQVYWLCKCDCGTIKSVQGKHLRSGKTTSCGCLSREMLSQRNTKHNHSNDRLYNIWLKMRDRCYNKKNKSYADYGGRGIIVCEEWNSDFMSFYNWSIKNGYDESLPTSECSIDRIDVNGNYCPSNCRWATIKEQANNKRNNRMITYMGKTQSVSMWADELNISVGKLRSRLDRNWTVERAFTTP